jgi:hypothetical protein
LQIPHKFLNISVSMKTLKQFGTEGV